MFFKSFITVSFLAASALAAPFAEVPSKVLDKRATTMCGSFGSVETGTYILYQNNWGAAAATSGSQCTTLDSLSGDTITWSTSWSWAGGPSNVKSYANVVYVQSTGLQLSSISSMPSVWDYSYTGSGITADVSYDMFTSSTATGANEYEIMIWLAALGGAGPLSSTGSPIATPTIGGNSWKLYSGPNGQTTVYSFVATSEITSYSGDIKLFLAWLVANEGFSTNQYLTSVGAGTEPFEGSNAVLSVSSYSISIDLGGTAPATSTKATTTAKATTTTKAATTSTKQTMATTTSKTSTSTGSSLYGQCGGEGWTGPTTCASGTCIYSNPWYSQCLN